MFCGVLKLFLSEGSTSLMRSVFTTEQRAFQHKWHGSETICIEEADVSPQALNRCLLFFSIIKGEDVYPASKRRKSLFAVVENVGRESMKYRF
jgi:hypothetical protein